MNYELNFRYTIKKDESHVYYKFNNVLDECIDNISKYPKLIFDDFTYACFSQFNKPVDNLPINLKYLVLESAYNLNIDLLPISMEYLCLGNKFNNNIDNLSNKLKTLILGNEFNKSLNCFPDSVENNVVGNKFDSPIKKLSKSLNTIRFSRYNKKLINKLPYCQLKRIIKKN